MLFPGHNPCSGYTVERIPHPESCRKFIVCVYGMRFEKECKEGRGFLPELRKCVPMRKCLTSTEGPPAIETTLQPEEETTVVDVETTVNVETTGITESEEANE